MNSKIPKNFNLAWPLAVNALLMQSMLMIDTLLVAPLGELAVAAMGLATTVVTFVLGLDIAIGNGIQLLVGRVHGANSKEQLAVSYWSGIVINLSAALAFFIILSLFSTQIITFIVGEQLHNEALISLTVSYIDIVKYVVLISAYTQVCTAVFNGQGKTRVPLLSFIFELPLNAVLSYFLIFGIGDFSGLGLEGAAWGSVTALVFRAAFLHSALMRNQHGVFSFPRNSAFLPSLKKQFDEIYPIAANFFVLSVGATVYQLLFAQLSLYSFVAITLISPWIKAATQFPSAWAQASAITVSQAIGKNDLGDIRSFAHECTKMGINIAIAVACLLFILSLTIESIFTNLEAETLFALGLIAPVYILLPIIRAYNTVSGNILRAVGKSKLVLNLHFITQWGIALPLCALLILYFDASIFWAFAMMPFEEALKIGPFYYFKKRFLPHL
ncbi:MATE family efflux transporter [Glaciecola sp. 2405UD65-10]|uniref:MATE family efflux transporter n=1 Tax=Glaciecola sp. 2405UD65-10 TaxID=3397244 RepID=UPI003B5B8C3B